MISIVHKRMVERLVDRAYVLDYGSSFCLVKYQDVIGCVATMLHLSKVEARIFLKELRSLGLCEFVNQKNIKFFLR